MDIYWRYIDKRAATVAALKDWGSMQYIIDHTDQEIKDNYAMATDPKSINLERVSPSTDVHASEGRIISMLDRMDVLAERYREAKEYMDWFLPAWKTLSETDQYVLNEFYGSDHEYGDGAIDSIAEYLMVERSSAYRRKNRALDKLTILLYGK